MPFRLPVTPSFSNLLEPLKTLKTLKTSPRGVLRERVHVIGEGRSASIR